MGCAPLPDVSVRPVQIWHCVHTGSTPHAEAEAQPCLLKHGGSVFDLHFRIRRLNEIQQTGNGPKRADVLHRYLAKRFPRSGTHVRPADALTLGMFSLCTSIRLFAKE